MSSEMNLGWVYILTNRSYQSNYLKIGYTTNDPCSRAAELSRPTGVATPFDVAYSEVVPDCISAEGIIHKELASYRVSSDREFFQVEFNVAQEMVHEVCERIRNISPCCHHCEARRANPKLVQRIRDQREQIISIEEQARIEVEHITRELEQHRAKIVRLKKYISFCGVCRNYLSKVFAIMDYVLQKAISDRHDRLVWGWTLGILCFVGWMIMVAISLYGAAALTLAAVMISAIMIIGSTQKMGNDDEG